MKKMLFILFLAILLFPNTTAYGVTKSDINVQTTGKDTSVTVNSQVQGSSQTKIESSNNSNISISTIDSGTSEVVIKNNTFKITGTITSVWANALGVSTQQILLDKTKVSNFSQKGELKVGNFATVEGIVSNGTLYASFINSTTPDQSNNNIATTSPDPKIQIYSLPISNSTLNNASQSSQSDILGEKVQKYNLLDKLILSFSTLFEVLSNLFKAKS